MSQNRWFWILGSVFMLLFIVGVVTVIVMANRPFAEYDIVSPTALPQFDPFIGTQTARPSPTLNPTTAMTVLPPPSSPADNTSYATCGWQWASQINQELTPQLQQQLTEALVNVDSVEGRVESFGENCLNQDGSVRYFATMQTDFRVIVQMSILETADPEAVPDIVSPVVLDILRVLSHYPVGSTPGPQPGQISIQFPAGDETYEIFISDYNTAMNALDQGLTGTASLDALGGVRS